MEISVKITAGPMLEAARSLAIQELSWLDKL